MATWDEFEAAAPELAGIGRALLNQFGVGLAFLATVDGTGAPRLHPVCPVLSSHGLHVLITAASPKRGDLARDGRYALQTFPQPKPGSDEFYVAGRARRVVKGDATCLSIATASILAKVTRDRIMRAEAEHYPLYDFEYNKGYPCPRHKLALKAWGPSAIHRRTWVFMEHLPWWRTSFDPVVSDQLAFDLA